jgi:hypothetical protein
MAKTIVLKSMLEVFAVAEFGPERTTKARGRRCPEYCTPTNYIAEL